MAYVKLFSTTLDSSIWEYDSDTRIVFMTILMMKDADGFVKTSPGRLAARAKVSLKKTKDALEKFMNPEPGEEDQDFQGRRIERAPGGFRVLNHEKYLMKDSAEERKRKDRERKRLKRLAKSVSADVRGRSANSAIKMKKKMEDEDAHVDEKKMKMRAHLCPQDWFPSEALQAYAVELDLTIDACIREADAMKDWSASSGNKKLDWDATFRNWLRRKAEDEKKRGGYRRQEQRPMLEEPWVKDFLSQNGGQS